MEGAHIICTSYIAATLDTRPAYHGPYSLYPDPAGPGFCLQQYGNSVARSPTPNSSGPGTDQRNRRDGMMRCIVSMHNDQIMHALKWIDLVKIKAE